MTHQLIASPYPDGHLIVSPGREGGIRVGAGRYAELRDATPAAPVPDWLSAAARAAWGLDLAGQSPGTRSWSARRPGTGTPALPTR
jgi:hypothetical protein